MNKDASVAPTVPNSPPKEATNSSPVPVLDKDSIKKIKVKELQDVLKAQIISTKGLKAELVDQLLQGVSEGVNVLQYRPPEKAKNNTGDAFAPRAYLKLLKPEGPPVDKSVTTIDGVRFRSPAVPAQEHAVEFDDHPKKEITAKPLID